MAEPLTSAEWEFWGTWMQAHQLLMREVDRALQRDCGISKAEFSVLVTLRDGPMRVTDLAASLDWEKARVAHQLTRMERRGLLERNESGAAGRRTGIALTAAGRDVADRAVLGHGATIRRLALDHLPPPHRTAIGEWSRAVVEELGGA
jgi:DNA-binding MarR family transcriptional regulator